MSDLVSTFCESIHSKLSTLESRMEILKSNVGSTWHSLQEKLEEVRERSTANRQSVAQSRIALEQWCEQHRNGAAKTNGEWDRPEGTIELASRATRAEQCAHIAVQLAESSFDDVERMVLEVIAARLEAEAATAT